MKGAGAEVIGVGTCSEGGGCRSYWWSRGM